MQCFKPNTTPRSNSGKRANFLPAVSASSRVNLFPTFLKEFDQTIADARFEQTIADKTIAKKKVEKIEGRAIEPLSKLNVSRSANNSPVDILDSLVRFEGDSDDFERKSSIKVNAKINLGLLFFDEQRPDWLNEI